MMRLCAALVGAAFLLGTGTPLLAVGTIFGLPLSQQLGENGKPLSGAKLYIYQANTSNPVTVYTDFALTVEATWPLEADAEGRLPQFWLSDGAYRVRLTTSGGIGVFDLQNVTALGPSSGAGGGGGVSDEQIFQSGDLLFRPVDTTRTGWVRANGRTIGSAASGATERANADTQTLFEYLWNNCTDTHCPVSSGRGANAATDFAANKTIQVWDMRGRSVYGLDTMGNSAASVVASATTAGAGLGAETQTIAQANLPNYNLSHNLDVSETITNGSSVVRSVSLDKVTSQASQGSGFTFLRSTTNLDKSEDNLSLANGSVSGTVSSGGSGASLPTLSPGVAGTWYIKL